MPTVDLGREHPILHPSELGVGTHVTTSNRDIKFVFPLDTESGVSVKPKILVDRVNVSSSP
jgi:hypothetical protein